jgi:hypothetical protein
VLKAITFENHHVEMSFLKNYLDIDCTYELPSEKPECDFFIVIGSKVSNYLLFLLKFRKRIKIFIHLSDEKVRFSSFLFYLLLPRNSLIIRQYFVDTYEIKIVIDYLKNIWAVNSWLTMFKLIPHLIIGIWKLLKFLLLKILKINVLRLPLGYTDNFIDHVSSLNLGLKMQKFEVPRWSNFFGVSGNITRVIGIESLRDTEIRIFKNLEWGGNKKHLVSNYVNALLEGNLSFNPPGYRSTDSFRFYESLFLGNAPVNLPISANSLGRNSNEFFVEHAMSWKSLIYFYEHLNQFELIDLISFQQFLFDQEIISLKSAITHFFK